MTSVPGSGTGIQVVLAALAVYHLGIGLVSAFSERATAVTVRKVYGLHLVDAPAFRYATKMLGLYGLVVGGLLAHAATNPPAHRDVIVAIIVLQSLRASFRVRHRDLLAQAFAVRRRDNLMAALLLVFEIAMLVVWFPYP